MGDMRAILAGLALGLASLATGAMSLPPPPASAPLVNHLYRSILHREADAAGLYYWGGRADYLDGIRVGLDQAAYGMAVAFYTSAEYGLATRDDVQFVTDLYHAFCDREPDAPGLAFWTAQLAAGLPREVAIAHFAYSPEFTAVRNALAPGNLPYAPFALVSDFYRGFLARLPDDDGLLYWAPGFGNNPPCWLPSPMPQGAEEISRSFVDSPEYAARARSDAEFVGDLYLAFLTRGGDLQGVRYWIDRLAAGATRDEVRAAFLASPEVQARLYDAFWRTCLLHPPLPPG